MDTLQSVSTLDDIYSVRDHLAEVFTNADISIESDDDSGEIVLVVRTGLVEPADGQQLHTLAEIAEIIED
jgi:hypothetical protein